MSLRRSHGNELKAKVALEAIKNEKTLSEIASLYEVHPNLVAKWKKQLLQNASSLFNEGAKNKKKGEEPNAEELFKQIGQLKVENDFLKKKVQSALQITGFKNMIDKKHKLSVKAQCSLLEINRSSLYYSPKTRNEDFLEKEIVKIYLDMPFYGYRS